MAYTLDDFGNLVSDAATSAKNKVVSLFKSDDAPGDYTTRSAAIARQRKLADMLSQMGEQEQAVSTAGGITAPMSGMGALARGLTSFGGAYLSGKASRDEEAATAAEKAAIQGGFADIFKRGDLVEQGAQLPDDAEGVPQYEVNTKVGGGKYILTPEDQQRRLIEFVGNHPGAAGQANLYSNLIGDERARADAERDRNQPTWRQPGDQLFTPGGMPVGRGVPIPPKITRMPDGLGGYYEFTEINGETTTTHHAADDSSLSGASQTTIINGVNYYRDENGDWNTDG